MTLATGEKIKRSSARGRDRENQGLWGGRKPRKRNRENKGLWGRESCDDQHGKEIGKREYLGKGTKKNGY